jgi:hypothetical protein
MRKCLFLVLMFVVAICMMAYGHFVIWKDAGFPIKKGARYASRTSVD